MAAVIPETAPARPVATARRADVQGLRALAVLMVVAFHAGLDVPGGFTGVDVFFVISGFVITAMLLREADGTGRFSLGSFYARRIRRIMPASAMTIGLVALLSIGAINASAHTITARTGVAGSLFTANILLARATNGYFDVAATSNPLLHIWTLSVEEQFYLVFPALVLVGLMMSRKRRVREALPVLTTVIGLVAVVSFAIGWYTSTHAVSIPGFPSSAQFAFYMAPARAWEFAVGALLALGVPWWRRLPATVAHVASVVGLAVVIYGAFALDGTTPFPGTAALIPVVGTALLVVAGTRVKTGLPGILGLEPIARVGDYSYSWYLWHWPFIVFFVALFPMEGNAALIGAAVSIIPAWLSFRFLETPFRHDPNIRGRRAVGVALVCIIVPIVCCLALYKVPLPSGSAATRALTVAADRPHADRVRGCDKGIPYGRLPAKCTWSVPDSKGEVLLIGDSNAGQFTEGAATAANQLGYDFTVASFPDCPFLDLRVSPAGRPQVAPRCRRFVAESLKNLEANPPKLVIVADSGPLYLVSTAKFTDPETGRTATTPAAKAAMWTVGLRRSLQRLDAAGIPVVVVQTVPQWRNWDARNCAEARVYLAPQTCGADQTRAEVAAFRARYLTAEYRALAAVPTATGIDLLDDLCTDRCVTNHGNVWIYKDGRHLSVTGSQRLAERFASIISQHAGAAAG